MAELTDAEWSAALADVTARQIAGTITPEQAAAEIATATANWPTRSLSNSDLVAQISRVLATLDGLIIRPGPPDAAIGAPGSRYLDEATGDFYGPRLAVGWGPPAFSLVGPNGLSAKAIVIAAELLPVGATDQDFADWLADAQIDRVQAAVQPMVDAVEADRQAVGAAAGQVEADRQAVDASAVQVEASRAAVAADRATVVTAVGEVEVDRQAVDTAAAAVEADRQAVDAAAGQVEADRQAVDASAVQVEANRAAVAADRATVVTAVGEVESDRQAVDTAAAAVEADRQAVDAAAGQVEADRQAVDAAAVQVETMRGEAQLFRNEALQFRNEAEDFNGEGFLNEAEADLLYRKLTDALAVSDVTGLSEALDGKADAVADHVQTAAYAATSMDRVLADTSAGGWSLTLPADGRVEVQDHAGTWPTHHLTVIGPIRGSVGDMVCDQTGALLFVRPPGAASWGVTKSEGVSA